MSRFYAAFALAFILPIQKTAACGYSFVGDCSTSISLKINGTTDSFAVAPCPNVLQFDGFRLGALQSLSIARAKAATWESCHNNVSGMALWYRVHEQGIPGGNWQSIDLQEDYNTLIGPYTTRYRSATANANLTNSLIAGKTYVLEIYFQAAIDSVGDDFIPETTLLQNNNGQNFHFTFQYGGAAAPPFLVATTKSVDVKCHGDSTGVAGVSVYGNQSGLFYQWSTGSNNYPILTHIPAGTYMVSVTGMGYSASDTIDIAQPTPLSAHFAVTGLGCDGTLGQASAIPFGGTAAYKYTWETGQQDSIVFLPDSGDYALTVTDANGCSNVFLVNIPTEPIVEMSVAATICMGETYMIAGNIFTTQGDYEINIPGIGGTCDTLIQLALVVRPSPAASMTFQVIEPFACGPYDPVHLVFNAMTNAENPTYEWLSDGQVVSHADTCHVVYYLSGVSSPNAPLLTVTDEHGCFVQTGDTAISIAQPVALQATAVATNPTGNLENGTINLIVEGGIPQYAVVWDNGSTGQSLTNLGPNTYCATVTDAHGCTIVVCTTLEKTTASTVAALNAALTLAPNPAVSGQWVEIAFSDGFADQEVDVEILDVLGRTFIRQRISLHQNRGRILVSTQLPAGAWIIHATGVHDGSAIGRLTIH